MKTFSELSEGQQIELLVGFYDINRFTSISRSSSPSEVVSILKEVGRITSNRI